MAKFSWHQVNKPTAPEFGPLSGGRMESAPARKFDIAPCSGPRRPRWAPLVIPGTRRTFERGVHGSCSDPRPPTESFYKFPFGHSRANQARWILWKILMLIKDQTYVALVKAFKAVEKNLPRPGSGHGRFWAQTIETEPPTSRSTIPATGESWERSR